MSSEVLMPNAVNKLVQDAMNGRASRRDIIKRGSALGLSGALMGNILRVSGVGAQDAQEAGWSLVKPEWLDVDLTGVELSAVLASDGVGAPFDQACCDFFAEQTGATVNYIKGAESATDRLTYYTQTLNAQASDFDIFSVDVIWPGILKVHAHDLSEAADELAGEGANFFERILSNNRIEDTLVSIPMYTDAGCLYTRTDLLEKYGVEAPTTWAELEVAAQTIAEGEVAEGNDAFVGFTFQGAAYEGLTCNALEWVYSNGGGTFIEPDGTVTVNSDAAKAAVERAVGWVGGIAPAAVTSYKEEDSRGVWQAGNAAFHRNWPYVYGISQADDSDLKDKFSMGLLPKGDGENADNAATLGGWNMMVSKYSENIEAATVFAKFMCSFEVQKARAIERSLNPTIVEVYQDADVLAANPYQAELFPIFDGGSVARPSGVTADLYNDVSSAVFTTVNELLSGQQTDVSGALDNLASQLESIMEDL
ncbi:MAG: ABC transporter substrate-binding protein [Thermomicrobiales bacterium]|nr:ABC transporter substrate-binding protein [Thermomicrobiales bacterium]MCO5218380.1 ABC transporter substrate-binding protein [Thermomicrobiales bacterium]MCO5224143.1 ABC transporter substrate-binding protein [Thermomicrobiales bacterium]MCO5227100.1 ABC transporter substrate-binding protein [Thermomicrobiales bacterium]